MSPDRRSIRITEAHPGINRTEPDFIIGPNSRQERTGISPAPHFSPLPVKHAPRYLLFHIKFRKLVAITSSAPEGITLVKFSRNTNIFMLSRNISKKYRVRRGAAMVIFVTASR